MSRKKKTSPVVLSPDEIKKAAEKMMDAALAHQRTSGYCLDNPDSKMPGNDAIYFPIVSFELILLSVEQSLRLLLLMHEEKVLDRVDHNLKVLYRAVRQKSGGKEDLHSNIICQMNALAKSNGIDVLSEKEVLECLKKHDSSYSDFRYFHLDKRAKVNSDWEMSARDVQIMHCLAHSLIKINIEKMNARGIGIAKKWRKVPRSKMTADETAILDRLKL